MKITFTSNHTSANIQMGVYSSPFFTVLSILCCCLFSMLTLDVAAQANAAMAPVPEISTEDYPGPKWKSPAEYSSVLSIEQSNTAAKLANPNLDEVQLGLYTGYARMISYMQESITNNMAIDEIAHKSYTRVLAEAPTDPIIKHMLSKDFDILYDALLPKLIRS